MSKCLDFVFVLMSLFFAVLYMMQPPPSEDIKTILYALFAFQGTTLWWLAKLQRRIEEMK